jgi:hypothetical protein
MNQLSLPKRPSISTIPKVKQHLLPFYWNKEPVTKLQLLCSRQHYMDWIHGLHSDAANRSDFMASNAMILNELQEM